MDNHRQIEKYLEATGWIANRSEYMTLWTFRNRHIGIRTAPSHECIDNAYRELEKHERRDGRLIRQEILAIDMELTGAQFIDGQWRYPVTT